MMAAKTKRHLLQELIALAETTVRFHIEVDEDEKCFNRFTFLEDLEIKLEEFFDRPEFGRFENDAHGVARLLLCHMALTSGDAPDGTTFRGMPMLD